MTRKGKEAPQSSGGSGKSKPPRGRPFQPGQSGNPGGRPKGLREVQDYAGEYTFEAVDKLVTIMRGRSAKEARQAAVAILDRACGKPAQPIGGVPNSPIGLDAGVGVIELLRKLAGDKD